MNKTFTDNNPRNSPNNTGKTSPIGRSALLLLTFVIAGTVLIFTYSGIRKRTQGSLEILHTQGRTLLTVLTEATDNAIRANGYFWDSFISRITPVAQLTFKDYNAEDALVWLKENAPEVTALAVYQFDDHLALLSSAVSADLEPHAGIEEDFFEAASELFADTSAFQSLIFLPDALHESATALYLEIDSTRTKGVCMELDFPGLWELENEIGIGPLIQRLGEAPNVVYIFYQDPEGLIFSSTPVDSALSIHSDPFLEETFNGDTLASRTLLFQDQSVLEFAEPFSSTLYPDGLFRLGISLDTFNAAKAEFNRQMIALAIVLFLVAALIPLYLGLRSEHTTLGISLARTQSLSATVLESMRSGVIAINADNSIELANQRVKELFSLDDESKDELQGASDWRTTALAKYLPADIFDTLSGDPDVADSQGLSNDTPQEFEALVSGERKHFLYTVAPIGSSGSGAPGDSGKALVIYDYTRQRELEEENARRERLVELGDLAAGVAHEIRNPLNAISLAAQRLDAEFAEQITTERKEFSFFTSQIRKETNRLDAIVSRLLGLTRAPKAKPQLNSVSDLFAEWIRFMQPEFDRDNVSLATDIDIALSARLDRDKLRQALGNLYRNSVEAFKESQSVPGADNPPLKIAIKLSQSEQGVKALISDNGPGIPAEVVDKLFTPYFTTKPEGSGLGLSISFRLITDMGGSLEFDKSYTDGARFVITLLAE
jgi:two-component system, NtrC family, sensor histidine kinase HydH